jgi:hypothetical protein
MASLFTPEPNPEVEFLSYWLIIFSLLEEANAVYEKLRWIDTLTWNLQQCASTVDRRNGSEFKLKLNKIYFKFITFLMGGVFFTIFNKIKDLKLFTFWKKYAIFEEVYLENYWTYRAYLGLKF